MPGNQGFIFMTDFEVNILALIFSIAAASLIVGGIFIFVKWLLSLGEDESDGHGSQ